jgi:CRISPR-associated exonuclease Cas4
MQNPIPLRVSDLKQYAYCPRVVYYQYLLPVGKKTTFKMDYGKIEESKIDKLEGRRKLKKYGLSEGKRFFHHFINSLRLGLSGKLDLLIETEKGYFPVDFKYTTGRPQKNHIYQLCGYALILDDIYGTAVEKGFVYLIPKDEAVVFELDSSLKRETIKMLGDIRDMIRMDKMPDIVGNRNKCFDCEYRNYCGDVF